MADIEFSITAKVADIEFSITAKVADLTSVEVGESVDLCDNKKVFSV